MVTGGSSGVDPAEALHVLAAAAEELRAPARADGPAGLARAAASELQNVLYREAQSAGDALAEAAAQELASVAAKLKEEAFATLKTVSAGSDLYGPRVNHTCANFMCASGFERQKGPVCTRAQVAGSVLGATGMGRAARGALGSRATARRRGRRAGTLRTCWQRLWYVVTLVRAGRTCFDSRSAGGVV